MGAKAGQESVQRARRPIRGVIRVIKSNRDVDSKIPLQIVSLFYFLSFSHSKIWAGKYESALTYSKSRFLGFLF